MYSYTNMYISTQFYNRPTQFSEILIGDNHGNGSRIEEERHHDLIHGPEGRNELRHFHSTDRWKGREIPPGRATVE